MNKAKFLSMSMAVVLCGTALTACGSSNSDKEASSSPSETKSGTSASAAPSASTAPSADANANVKGKITFITNRTDLVNDGTFEKYKKAFIQKYPNVTDVEFEGITNYESDIRVRLNAGEVGDVVLIPGNIANADMGNFFEPVNDLADSLGDIYFHDFKANEGKVYGIVAGVNTEGLVYNKTAFAKAGIAAPPKTLDELYADCEKLKAVGITPMYINMGAQWPMKQWGEVLVPFMSGNAKYLDTMLETDEPFKVDNEFGKGFSIVRTLIQKGYVEKDLNTNVWEASKPDVATGKAGMYFLGNWVINQLIGAGGKSEDIGFSPFPYDNSGKLNAPLNPDWFYAISKNSKNKDTAKAWIKFLVEDAGYVESSGFIPPQKSKKSDLPQISEFMAAGANMIESVPTSSKWNEVGNLAQIDFYGGKYIQTVAVAKDLKGELDKLNAKWKKARASAK
ncbi:ABC transporter substrate-binding protein [Gorillibacterium massiliense]|uniref:ABC transporter substrate-binding protein n=1 Tax=Gorillibacterium massiliense TaxID=1280390 RepID=UPI0004AFA7B3|nr:ABC transporter substrate-binding protein [Gorillibacterium massiliense]